jgi:hypothetical protein
MNKIINSIIFLTIIEIFCLINAKKNKIDNKVENSDQNNSNIDIGSLSVRFHIFTSQNGNKTIDLKNKSDSIDSICDKKSKYKFIVHGFAETWTMDFRWNWVSSMIKEMLKSDEASKLCIIAVEV